LLDQQEFDRSSHARVYVDEGERAAVVNANLARAKGRENDNGDASDGKMSRNL